MFKRFQKTLDGDLSSDSEDSSDLEDAGMAGLESEEELREQENSSGSGEDGEEEAEDADESESPSEAESGPPEPLGIVTEEELATADPSKKAEDDEYNYHCTLCPHKVLASLADVQAHLKGKEHLARERRATQMISLAEQAKQLDPPTTDVELAAPPSPERQRHKHKKASAQANSLTEGTQSKDKKRKERPEQQQTDRKRHAKPHLPPSKRAKTK